MSTSRVAVHVHSRWSYDAKWELDDLARAFARRGYGAVLMAEHDRGFDADRLGAYREACARASAAGALLVPGIEYSDRANAVHVPTWGEVPFLGEGRQTGDVLAAAAEWDGLAMLAHPARRDVHRLVEPDWLAHLCGVEVWNRKYDGWAPSRPALELAARRGHLIPFVGLDFHTERQFFPLAMAVELEGPLNEDSLLAALRARRCRPVALGLPALRLARGPGLAGATALEGARRSAARVRRRVRAQA